MEPWRSPRDDALAVSVVIACHAADRLELLGRSVASARTQRRAPHEVIVSVDNNAQLFDSLVMQYADAPDVHVVANTGLRGASATRNRGAAVASGAVIAFLDDDATADDDWLDRLASALNDTEVVGVGGGVRPCWQTGRPRWFPDEFMWVVGASYRGMPETPTPVRNVWSENMAVRAGQFAAVGGFREGFGKRNNVSRPEDTELCMRMANELGGRWIYLPDAQVEHYVPAARSTIGFFVRRCHSEGRGKIELAALTNGALAEERGYVTRTIPAAVGRQLRRALGGDSDALLCLVALLAGCVAAGVGAAQSVIRRKAAGLIASRRPVGPAHVL